MDESALGQSVDEDRAVNAMTVYILNPWPWFAVGIPIVIIAAISLVGYHRRKRGNAKTPT